MAATTKVFNSKNVLISVGGIPIDSGRADGTFLTLTYEEDDVALAIGADGEGTFSVNNNDSATMTLNVMQTSTAHLELTALHALGKQTLSGMALFPILITDLNSGIVYSAAETAFMKRPDAEYGREAGEREWALKTVCLKTVGA